MRRLGILAAVILALSGAGTNTGDALGQAQDAFRARDFRGTVTLLDPYITAHPRDARALVLRGDARAELNDNTAALDDYNRALAIAPDYEYGYVTRCETRLQLDDVSGAQRDCDAALRLDPQDAHAYEDRGDVEFQRTLYQTALDDYDRAIALGRSNAYLFAARCDSERLVGKREAAAADCAHALLLEPASRRGLWARGRLAIVNGRYADGVADLTAYIAQRPDASTTAYYFRGYAYNRMNRWSDALADEERYLRAQSGDADALRERGIARNGNGDVAGAVADLRAAAAAYGRDADTANALNAANLADAAAARKPLTLP